MEANPEFPNLQIPLCESELDGDRRPRRNPEQQADQGGQLFFSSLFYFSIFKGVEHFFLQLLISFIEGGEQEEEGHNLPLQELRLV